MKPKEGSRRLVVAITAWAVLLATIAPTISYATTPADDLKQIEYRYYFRGKYQQAIEALQTYIARVDLPATDALRAREFLAASYVLAGAPDMGKEVFTRIVVADPSYAGPDPTIFKLDVMDVYAQARSEYAALALKSVPPAGTEPLASPQTAVEEPKKPIYKKWWLYAGAAAVAIALGVAAGGGDDAPSDGPAAGTVIVGVTVK
jgi:hypothetical protein